MSHAPSPLRDLAVEDRIVPPTAFAYVHCDVPAGMTLDEWRLAHSRSRRATPPHRWRERPAARFANLRRSIRRR